MLLNPNPPVGSFQTRNSSDWFRGWTTIFCKSVFLFAARGGQDTAAARTRRRRPVSQGFQGHVPVGARDRIWVAVMKIKLSSPMVRGGRLVAVCAELGNPNEYRRSRWPSATR